LKEGKVDEILQRAAPAFMATENEAENIYNVEKVLTWI